MKLIIYFKTKAIFKQLVKENAKRKKCELNDLKIQL